jgi:succinyl-CoA synthetase beta subunit
VAPLPPGAADPGHTPGGVLTADQALSLCQAHGIPVATWSVAHTPQEAARAADDLGYPVALKILAPQIVHKSDVGGVALNLEDASGVRRAAEAILARAGDPARLMVQRMVTGGVEVILGGRQDPSFGPVVMFGLGGIHVEVFDDVSFRVAPIGRVDAEEMLAEVRGSRLLAGIRGAPPVDREALIEALLALSRILVAYPRINELEVNPLVILEDGATALDARGVVEG